MNDPNTEETIFAAARQLPPADRAAYLDQACGDNGPLRRRVEALLNASEQSGAFLEVSAAPTLRRTPAASIPLAEKPGDKVGRYKLLQQIGEGGCGVVYMAEQEEPVRRRVALKIIKLGMDTKSVIARFEAERQALAMMDHPNIAKVFDAGATETGRPYFVMELVRGVKITDYCDEQKLSTRERLDLFIQVCHAIQHAHQKGIIHRDIKPSNILVTMQDCVPVPKVIDFGIVKATGGQALTDKTVFTAFEQFIGTPAYMSPEQAMMTSQDIDTRSDIYALGVLLYELLTGKTPFDAKELLAIGLDELRRTICEKEPDRPSTRLSTMPGDELGTTAQRRGLGAPKLVSQLRGDLDCVVMKALEKDRSRRYETANGFARDIERHLNNEPVVACPPSAVYRLQKMVRRNKLVFAAGSAVILALLVGFGVSTWMYFQEREARRAAVTAEIKQIRLREETERLEQYAQTRLKIEQAYDLFNQGQIEMADRLIASIPITHTNRDDGLVFADLGYWYIVRSNLNKAIERLAAPLTVTGLDESVNARESLWYGAAVAESGDPSAYNRFRESMIARYVKNEYRSEQRVLDITLLTPANVNLLKTLNPFAEKVAADLNDDHFRVTPTYGGAMEDNFGWDAYTLALWEYRCTNYPAAEMWGQRAADTLPTVSVHNAFAANLKSINAMTHFRLGKVSMARAELAEARTGVEKQFQLGLGWSNWNDWFTARIFLREARELIDGVTETNAVSK